MPQIAKSLILKQEKLGGSVSYTGDPYKYDVFVSYPHAVEALRGSRNMRDWSRKVADDILEYVTMALADEDGGDDLRYYLDRDEAVSADPLTDTLEDAVQHSAVLVILMSPYYRRWCVQELNWFFAKAKTDGRGFRQCVLIEVQKTDEKVWPDLLRDKAGERLFRKELMEKDGLPFGFEQFKSNGTLPDTKGVTRGLGIEIADKLIEVRKQRMAARALEDAKQGRFKQRPADERVFYLESTPQDMPIWASRRDRLAETHAIVLPEELVEQGLAEMSESLLGDYMTSDGLILHRTRPDDSMRLRIRRAFQNRRLLLQRDHKDLPWVVLDELPDEPLPSADTFRVTRISACDEGWPIQLFEALFETDGEAAPAP